MKPFIGQPRRHNKALPLHRYLSNRKHRAKRRFDIQTWLERFAIRFAAVVMTIVTLALIRLLLAIFDSLLPTGAF